MVTPRGTSHGQPGVRAHDAFVGEFITSHRPWAVISIQKFHGVHRANNGGQSRHMLAVIPSADLFKPTFVRVSLDHIMSGDWLTSARTRALKRPGQARHSGLLVTS